MSVVDGEGSRQSMVRAFCFSSKEGMSETCCSMLRSAFS